MNELDTAGLKTGLWEEPDPHGGTVAGEYKDGQRTGLWRHLFRDGGVHGHWKRWTDRGILIDEGNFDHGAKTGSWTYYAPNGSIKKTTNHRPSS